jgi:RNA polymerase sigma-70 factor, ECF subfamily
VKGYTQGAWARGRRRGNLLSMTTVLTHPAFRRPRTDDELVAAVRAGRADAFDAIHDRYVHELLGYARQVLAGAHHDAEEVVQDAFVKALNALRADDRSIALRPWLYTIVRNRALDELRRPKRSAGVDPEELMLSDPDGDPLDRMIERHHFDRVLSGIRKLPQRQREALVLRELDGRTHEEVAQHLGITTGASKTLLHRARGNLVVAA